MADKFINETGLGRLRDWIKNRINTKLSFASSGRKATFTNVNANNESVDIQNINSDRSSIYILANGLQTTNYLPTESAVDNKLAGKQDTLESGTNLKTINGNSILGAGNIETPKGIDFEVGVEKWYGTYKENGVTYQVYSKVLFIPALPSTAGITTYQHGVTGIKQILCIYGSCSNSMVMNAPRQVNSDNICIYQVQKSGKLAIEVGKDRSSISAYVTIIYAKNN